MEPTAQQLQLASVFFPHAFKRQMEVAQSNTRFVHYTSAEVAFNILTKAEVWMRNAQVMNDFSEIEYGLSLLDRSYGGAPGDKFKQIMEEMFPGICEEIKQRFVGWLPHFRPESYICCLSEHKDSEDRTGRLSMWRAYGGSSGVAIVVRNAPFIGVTNVLGAYSSPVAYSDQEQFDKDFTELASAIEGAKEPVSALDREVVIGYIFTAFLFAALCTKHPGFAEEREWRVIHAPALHQGGKVVHAFETVGGVPQSVYKIPLQDWPDEGFVGLAIPSFVDRIIIGPSQLPGTLFSTFFKVLTDAGVADVQNKLFRSDIPLRR